MSAIFHKPTPNCPICGSKMFAIWIKMDMRNDSDGEIAFKGVFACTKCHIRWRMEQPSTKAPVPICPTCAPNPVDMAIHLVDSNKNPISWVCWEDGTILRNVGAKAHVEPFEVRAAV